tara:strand:+ start:397 stop:1056 length:660 start_codon:yes stop_codon:yes gene_type:complete
MHSTIKNLNNIKDNIQQKINELNYENYQPQIIAVSKTFKIDHIMPLINEGHKHYGENKVQEAVEKWTEVKKNYPSTKLHLIGKLQTNKVKFVLPLFDYIHSLDNLKLAIKISDEQKKKNFRPKIFIQINLGKEKHKNGIEVEELSDFYSKCTDLDLNILGIMCLPPYDEDPKPHFSKMKEISESKKWALSMGMSSDYIQALEFKSDFLRIGSNIFGKRD